MVAIEFYLFVNKDRGCDVGKEKQLLKYQDNIYSFIRIGEPCLPWVHREA